MKIKLTEAQIAKLPLNEDVENSPLFKIYEKSCIEANEKLNGLYLKLTSYTIADVLGGTDEIDRIETISSNYHHKIEVMSRTLDDKIEAVPEEQFFKNEDMYIRLRDMIDNGLEPVWRKNAVISELAYSLQQLYYKVVEEEETNLGQIFGDIRTIDV